MMRRFVALILLTIFLFNTAGYYILYQAVRSHSTTVLLKRLDNDLYQQEETVTLKLPIVIPYQSNTDYQRVNGSFEHDGEYYKLIKQKIENDTLIVVCYRDQAEKKLSNLMTDYAKVVNDVPASSKSNTLKLLNSFAKEYEVSQGTSILPPAHIADIRIPAYKNVFFAAFKVAVTSPPPEAQSVSDIF